MRMKKIRNHIIVIVLVIFFTPINIFAADVDSGNDKEIMKFEDIENEILENNPMALINKNVVKSMEEDYKRIKDISDDLEDDRDDLEDAIDMMELQIDKLKQDKASLETKIDGDPDLINHIKLNYDALIGIYEYNKASLVASRRSLREQQFSLDDQAEDLDDTINKFRVQSKMSDCQLVWTAQNLYISYQILGNREMDLSNQTELMKKQLEIAKVKESLGKIIKTDIDTLEMQINEMEMGLNDLQTQKSAILGEFNLMIGNSYDFALSLDTELEPVYENFNEMYYDKDLESVLENNYSIALQTLERETKQRILNRSSGSDTQSEEAAEYNLKNEEIKLEETKRSVTFSFYKVYEELISKKMSFEQEKKKLDQAGTNRNYTMIRYDLGKISDLELENENLKYRSQEINTYVAEYELIQAYWKYEWMKSGLTLS
ncbi:TolC family protein [Anaerocolumna sedimenticola]